jgi:hypothetical protein
MHWPPLPQEKSLVFIFRGWVDPRAHGSFGSYGKNSPATPPGIDPETVRLVAQCLNHYATPGPRKGEEATEFTITLNAFTNVLCTEAGGVWRNKGPCSAPRPASKGSDCADVEPPHLLLQRNQQFLKCALISTNSTARKLFKPLATSQSYLRHVLLVSWRVHGYIEMWCCSCPCHEGMCGE